MISRKIIINLFSTLSVIIISLFIFTSQARGETTPSKARVDVIEGSAPLVNVSKIPTGTKLNPYLSCLAPDYLNRHKDYMTNVNKTVKCMNGYLEATALNHKIADVEQSISILESRIESLIKSDKYLSGFKDMNGVYFSAIPAGFVTNNIYPTAKNLSSLCLVDTNGNKESGVITGDYLNLESKVFKEVSPEQVAIISRVLKENKVIQKKIEAEENKNGDVSGATIFNVISQARELNRVLSKEFIPLTKEDVEKNYKNYIVNDWVLSTQIVYKLDSDKQKVKHGIPFIFKGLASIAGVKGPSPLVETYLSLNSKEDSATIFAWLPEDAMLKEFKELILKHIKQYNDIKDQFVKLEAQLQEKLKELEKNAYYCN